MRAVKGVAILALASLVCWASTAIAQAPDHQAEARSEQCATRAAMGGAEETDNADRRETGDAIDSCRAKLKHPPTTRQKRIFVLGLAAQEKK